MSTHLKQERDKAEQIVGVANHGKLATVQVLMSIGHGVNRQSTLFLEFAKRSLGNVGLPPKGKEGWGRFVIVAGITLATVPFIYFLLSESKILG